MYNIVKKFRAKNRAHAITLAIENGMLQIKGNKSLAGYSPEEYILCLICNRTFNYHEVKEIEHEPFIVNHIIKMPVVKICPYEDCPLKEGMAAMRWVDVLEEHPEYPEIPEHGVVY